MEIIEKICIFTLFYSTFRIIPIKAVYDGVDDELSLEQLLRNFFQDPDDCGFEQQIINWKTETNSVEMKPSGVAQQVVQENNQVAQQLDSEIASYLDYPAYSEVAQPTHRGSDEVAQQANSGTDEVAQPSESVTDEVVLQTDRRTDEIAQQTKKDDVAQQRDGLIEEVVLLTNRGTEAVALAKDSETNEVAKQVDRVTTDYVAHLPETGTNTVVQQDESIESEIVDVAQTNEDLEKTKSRNIPMLLGMEIYIIQQQAETPTDDVAQQTKEPETKEIVELLKSETVDVAQVGETSGVAQQNPVEVMERYQKIKTENREWSDRKIAQILKVKNGTLNGWKRHKKYSKYAVKPRKHKTKLQKLKLLDRYEKLCKKFPKISYEEASRRLKIPSSTLRGWQKRYGTEEGN